MDAPPVEKVRADSDNPLEQGQIVLLVTIATEITFSHPPERLTPSKLEFSSAISARNGAVVVDSTDGTEYRRDNILVL